MPEVAANTTEAVLSSWPLAENVAFAKADVIATVETAKAVVDVAAEADGVLLKLLVAPGAEVEIGAAIALIGAPGEQVSDLDAVLAELGAGAPALPADEAPPSDPAAAPGLLDTPEAVPAPASAPSVPAPIDSSSTAPSDRVFASPLARRLAKSADLPIGQIEGTGPNGRVLRRDVELALSPGRNGRVAPGTAGAVTSDGAPWTDVPHSKLRRLIAARLTESKQTAPHFYLRATVNARRLLDLRREVNEGAAVRISVNDLVIKAVAGAHLQVPALNVVWTEDAIRAYSSVDVSVAVATDNGLVTPVVRSVQDMSISAVARTVQDFAQRARSGRLQQHELAGGTISVTNLGMYGTEEFAAIINPPQASILAVGAARDEPVVVDGVLSVDTVMRLTLSVDHRPVDGATAAEWMRALVSLLEHPARILA